MTRQGKFTWLSAIKNGIINFIVRLGGFFPTPYDPSEGLMLVCESVFGSRMGQQLAVLKYTNPKMGSIQFLLRLNAPMTFAVEHLVDAAQLNSIVAFLRGLDANNYDSPPSPELLETQLKRLAVGMESHLLFYLVFVRRRSGGTYLRMSSSGQDIHWAIVPNDVWGEINDRIHTDTWVEQ